MTNDYDVIVVGGGMVGAALAYGLAGTQRRVLMLDGADTDHRAAKANFGLVWAHGKGFGCPAYQRLSIRAVQEWPAFCRQLEAESGMSVAYERNGGLHFCLSERELTERASRMQALHAQAPELPNCVQVLDRSALSRRFPTLRLGVEVAGATLGNLDGHVNPLKLLAALQSAFVRRGGRLRGNHAVTGIRALPSGGYEVSARDFRAHSPRVVIAAGLGSVALGAMVGLDVPLRPQRGQLLVTERLAPLLPIPASGLRQTGEGTVMIGVTQEEVGYDLGTTTEHAAHMARRALRILPDLAHAKLVRQWSCLRVMTPDGNPVYARSVSHPGVDIASCHSGVTLASFHAGPLAESIAAGALPVELQTFHHERFNVQKAA